MPYSREIGTLFLPWRTKRPTWKSTSLLRSCEETTRGAAPHFFAGDDMNDQRSTPDAAQPDGTGCGVKSERERDELRRRLATWDKELSGSTAKAD